MEENNIGDKFKIICKTEMQDIQQILVVNTDIPLMTLDECAHTGFTQM